MEAVKSFNAELSSLYEMKPPISKAKMTAITKGAIKAVKFYKHVVQSVEKFLQKCRPEYKIPGLYVIDSIVRQSRHQFGADKDVFAPRFSKNITFTFYSIYQCTNEEKSKVIRVLNLWQKNAVFPPEVIQPLFDMADSSHPKYKEVALAIHSKVASSSSAGKPAGSSTSANADGLPATSTMNGSGGGGGGGPVTAAVSAFEDASNDASQSLVMGNLPNLSSTEMSLATRLQHLQHLFGQEPPGPAGSTAPPAGSPAKAPPANDTGQIRFNKKLLDFDYDEDEEPDKAAGFASASATAQPVPPAAQPPAPPPPAGPAAGGNESLGSLLTNPDILRHLHSLQQQMVTQQQQPAVREEQQHPPRLPGWEVVQQPHQPYRHHHADYSLPPPGFIPAFPSSIQPQPPVLRDDLFHPLQQSGNNGDMMDINNPAEPPPPPPSSSRSAKERDRRRGSRSRSGSRGRTGSSRRHRSRSRDRTGSSSARRPRSSRSRSRSPRSSRNNNSSSNGRSRGRSRSPPPPRGSQAADKERMEREKERERRRRGLPPLKKECLSVCSTTLWVGHLSKLVQQEELSDTFGQYGEITSIDLIPPRGCAFVCMLRRQDAYRALTKLAGQKLQGKAITLAWAPGKGVKAKEWKDFWEVDQGVSYIPWQRLGLPGSVDLEALEEGSSFDEESLPPWMRHLPHLHHSNAMDGAEVIQPPPHMLAAPAGFIPMTAGAGPTTPEMAAAGRPGSAPLGVNPVSMHPAAGLLGMPGLGLGPTPAAAAGLTNLLGQSILAMNAAAAAAAAAAGPPGPAGFFNVFNNPHLAAAVAQQHQQQQAALQQNSAALRPSGEDGDDMELEESDEANPLPPPPMPPGGRRSWNNSNGPPDHHLGQQDGGTRNPPSLLDRLRTLANHDMAQAGGPAGLNGTDFIPGNPHHHHLLSPSHLRGAPLTVSDGGGIRPGGEALFSPGGGRMLPDADSFMARHLAAPPRHGGFGDSPHFGPSRGSGGLNPHSPRGGGGGGRGLFDSGRGGRGGFHEPSRGWDDDPHPPPPHNRWRNATDNNDWDREVPPRWDRGGGRGGNADWGGVVSPRGRNHRDRDRGGRDRGFGADRRGDHRGGGGGGMDRRRSGGDRDHSRDPPPPPREPPDTPSGSSSTTTTSSSGRRRGPNRWGNRSPEPPVPSTVTSTDAAPPQPPEAPTISPTPAKDESAEAEAAAAPLPTAQGIPADETRGESRAESPPRNSPSPPPSHHMEAKQSEEVAEESISDPPAPPPPPVVE